MWFKSSIFLEWIFIILTKLLLFIDLSYLSMEQIHQLLTLLQTNLSSRDLCVSLPEVGNYPQAFSCNSSSPWIIDSGATDHMTGTSHLFLFIFCFL